MSNRMKSGVAARVGLFAAIAAMFGDEVSRKRFDEHLGQKPSGGYSKGDTKCQTHGSRAGFKLVKKMYRYRGYAGAVVSRKVRQRAERTARTSYKLQARWANFAHLQGR